MKKINEVTDLFFETVANALESNLRKAREKDPNANSALLDIDVVAALKGCGADSVDVRVSVVKGTQEGNKNQKYTFVTVIPKADGIGERIEFSQRHQAHKAEVKGMEELATKLTNFKEANCIAGLTVIPGPEGKVRKEWSFKWDSLVISGEGDDAKRMQYSGPIRKWNADTNTYDVPVID